MLSSAVYDKAKDALEAKQQQWKERGAWNQLDVGLISKCATYLLCDCGSVILVC